MLTKEDVLSILKTHPNGNIEEPQFKKKFPEHYQILSIWDFPSNFKFTQKLFHYFNDDPELKLGLCPVCGNRCKFTKFNKGYHQYCSKKCVQLDTSIQNKKKVTCIKKYGTDNYSKTKESKEHIKQVYKSKSKSDLNTINSKRKQTNFEKYGNENYNNSEKYKQTCLERYGVENYAQTDEYIDKFKKTCLVKYGTEHYSYSNEFHKRYEEFCLKTYGTINSFQSEMIKEKSKQTCLEKYGKEYYTQTHEYSKNKIKKIKYDNLTFDSNWEVIVHKYCKKYNIPCVYQPNIKLEYSFENVLHTYQPDFLINGKLYEVKGNQFFDGDKMICPYNRNKHTDDLIEAKHQCMIKNNVIILRGEDIKKMKEML